MMIWPFLRLVYIGAEGLSISVLKLGEYWERGVLGARSWKVGVGSWEIGGRS
jgi:hypothetical protein